MKKQLLLLLFTGLSLIANGQWILGGNFAITSQKSLLEAGSSDIETSLVGIVVLPRLSYSLKESQWLGLETGLISTYSDRPGFSGSNTDEVQQLFSISPFYRHIFKPADILGIWIEAQGGAGFGSSRTGGEKDDKYSTFAAGIRPGIILFIGQHLSFEASFGRLGYSYIKVKDAGGSNDAQSYSELGFSFNSVNNPVNLLLLDRPQAIGGFYFGINWKF
jgi:hypothetical protein